MTVRRELQNIFSYYLPGPKRQPRPASAVETPKAADPPDAMKRIHDNTIAKVSCDPKTNATRYVTYGEIRESMK